MRIISTRKSQVEGNTLQYQQKGRITSFVAFERLGNDKLILNMGDIKMPFSLCNLYKIELQELQRTNVINILKLFGRENYTDIAKISTGFCSFVLSGFLTFPILGQCKKGILGHSSEFSFLYLLSFCLYFSFCRVQFMGYKTNEKS